MKVVIVGGVAGGATTAARIRRLSEKAEIVLFERGEYVSYANCGLPYYIGNVISNRERLFLQSVEGFKASYNVDVRVHSDVLLVDVESKTVSVKNLLTGETYTESYDKLVLSTGAEPIKPPIVGIENDRVFTLRNVVDTDRIKQFVEKNKPQKAVVVGGGFIGLEMVESLHALGIDVSLVERANQVMAPIDFGMATMVHQQLISKGVDLFLEENVTAFSVDGESLKVHLESQNEINTDLVILSIGVRPEVKLAKEAGLILGSLGGIQVNDYMQTSNEDVYALGDTVEVFNPLINKFALIPLAGPANKQGRIVADNIIRGNSSKYEGSIGTSIAKVFDLTVASSGVSAKVLRRENVNFYESYTHGYSHAGYYPNALPLSIKINFAKLDGKLLGAQVVGYDGVDKRIELFSQVMKQGGTIYDLQEIEHAYAPPYSAAKDPVNIAGFVAQNILEERMKVIHWDEFNELDWNENFLLDARTTGEYSMGHIGDAVGMPVEEIRERLNELPKDKNIIIYCAVGLRGYQASAILRENGFYNVWNLSGGYRTYLSATSKNKTNKPQKEMKKDPIPNFQSFVKPLAMNIDAIGLQCPGPIMQLKQNYDKIGVGEQLEIKVTDQAFGEDLKGWTNMVGAKIVSMENSGGVITARVEKLEKKEPISHARGDNKTMIVFSDDMDKALATFVIANGAAASGKKVSLFFTFWGLNVIKKVQKPKVEKDLLGKMFSWMLPSSSKKLSLSQMNMGGLGSKMMRYVMKKKKVESLENLIQQAKENGVEFIACSMSMDVMGVKENELLDDVTIGGVAAYLDRAEQANVNLFI